MGTHGVGTSPESRVCTGLGELVALVPGLHNTSSLGDGKYSSVFHSGSFEAVMATCYLVAKAAAVPRGAGCWSSC